MPLVLHWAGNCSMDHSSLGAATARGGEGSQALGPGASSPHCEGCYLHLLGEMGVGLMLAAGRGSRSSCLPSMEPPPATAGPPTHPRATSGALHTAGLPSVASPGTSLPGQAVGSGSGCFLGSPTPGPGSLPAGHSAGPGTGRASQVLPPECCVWAPPAPWRKGTSVGKGLTLGTGSLGKPHHRPRP